MAATAARNKISRQTRTTKKTEETADTPCTHQQRSLLEFGEKCCRMILAAAAVLPR